MQDSADAVIKEFRSVVGKLRTELNDAFRNAEVLLENIGKPETKSKGTPSGDLLPSLSLLLVMQ